MCSYYNLKYSKKYSKNIVILFIIGLLSTESCYASYSANHKGLSLQETTYLYSNFNKNFNTNLNADLNTDLSRSNGSKSQSANSINCQKADLKWLIYSYTNLHSKDNEKENSIQFKQFETEREQVDKVGGCSCSKITSLKQEKQENSLLEHNNGLQAKKQDNESLLNRKAIDFGFKFKAEDMILIEEGEFLQGTNQDCAILTDNESPAHYEYVKHKFYLDKYEVSNLDFSLFIMLTGYRTQAEKLNSSFVFEGLINDELKFKIQNNEDDKFNYQIAQVPWWYNLANINWFKINKNNTSIFKISVEELSRKFKKRFVSDSELILEHFDKWIKQYTNEIELLEHPVVHVSWEDAKEFCRFFGKRLPTEQEWEFACKSDYKLDDALYAWGNKLVFNESGSISHFANLWQGQFPIKNTSKF